MLKLQNLKEEFMRSMKRMAQDEEESVASFIKTDQTRGDENAMMTEEDFECDKDCRFSNVYEIDYLEVLELGFTPRDRVRWLTQ